MTMTTINTDMNETLLERLDYLKERIDTLNHILTYDKNSIYHDRFLKYANDFEVVLTAVQNHWQFLESASNDLQQNPQIRSEAFKQCLFSDENTITQLQSNKEVMALLIKKHAAAIQFASPELRADPELVELAIQSESKNHHYRGVIKFISEDLRDNRNFILGLVAKLNYGINLEYLSGNLRKDREVVLAAVTNSGHNLEYASEELRDDNEIVHLAIKNSGYEVFKYASDRLKNDKPFILKILTYFSYSLYFVSETLCDDREVVLTAVKHNGDVFDAASERLRNDREIALTAIGKAEDGSGRPFRDVGDELRHDRQFILDAMNVEPWVFTYLDEEFRNDRELAMLAVQRRGGALSYLSKKLQNDREIVLNAVNELGCALEYASAELKNDREVVLTAVSNNGSALRYASPELQNDYEMILLAVKKDGLILQLINEELRNDRNIILNAIDNTDDEERGCRSDYDETQAFCLASASLQADRSFVLDAVKINGSVLQFVNEIFLNDYEIIYEAVKNTAKALAYVSDKFRNKREIILAAASNHDGLDSDALEYANPEFCNDREIILKSILSGKHTLAYASDNIKDDYEIVLAAVKNWPQEFIYASENLRNNREILTEVFQSEMLCTETILAYLNDALRDDRQIVLAAIKHDPSDLIYVSERLRRDPEIISAARDHEDEYVYVTHLINNELCNDRDVALNAIANNQYSLEMLSDDLRDNKEIVMAAVKNADGPFWDTSHFGCASERLRNDYEVAFEAVKNDYSAFRYMSDKFRNTYEIALAAVGYYYNSELLFASDELRNNREIVLAYCSRTAYNKIYADDYEIVLKSVSSNGQSIKYASDRLRADREIVLTAVKKDGKALKYANRKYRNDLEIVSEALKHNNCYEVFLYIDAELLQKNRWLIFTAINNMSEYKWDNPLAYLNEEWRNDFQIVIAAVEQSIGSLKFAGKQLLSDSKFVSAIANLGICLDDYTLHLFDKFYEH